MDILARIKRLVARGQYRLTSKAIDELEIDGLDPQDAIEAILNAQSIRKTLRSTSRYRRVPEKLYVIESFNYSGTLIYTKRKIERQEGQETFYLLISSKIGTNG